MKKVRGANGQFFRDLSANGMKPVVVPREAVLSGRDLSKFFHHKVNRVLAALKKLYLSHATYEQDGQQKELVVFCQPKHMRCFLAVQNHSEARLAFQREIMQNREWRPRSEYLTQSQLQMRGLGEDTVRAVLADLYNEKATYEKEGKIYQAVKCYANGPKRTVLGLDNTKEARGLFANRVIVHKKRSILKHRQNVCLGNGWLETVKGNIERNTNLDREDIESLGRGFYNRVSAVRRQMIKWNKAGHSYRRVMSWSMPGNRGECAAPWVVFSSWKRELESLKGIILLAEFCKSNNLNFQTEFMKDSRRTKENRSR